MKVTFTIPLVLFLFLCACSFKNENITKLKEPDIKILKDFNISEKYEVVYQFYQEYKTTDKVSHLIAIVRAPEDGYKLQNRLPMERSSLKQLSKIEVRKFLDGRPIIFNPERSINADIRTAAYEYGSGDDLNVFHANGYYKIISSGKSETIFVCDTENKLMYIEAVK